LTDLFQTVDSDRLRAEAERILSQPEYRVETTTSERFSTWVRDMWLRFLEFLESVAGLVGGPLVLGLILILVVVVAAVLIARNLGKRRAREMEERIRREHVMARGDDPGALEDAADMAAAAGELAEAVRLRFRAGLLRLDEVGLITYRPGLTSNEITDLLRSPLFEKLARRFDEIVYGRQPATAIDYENSKLGWRDLTSVPVDAGKRL
jgi:hypothetical protein